MQEDKIDLELLGLRGGQATAERLELEPRPPVLGGNSYAIRDGSVPVRVEVSRTTSGFALRLLAETTLAGPCARCLEPVELPVSLELREVEQAGTGDPELSSPYVDDGILDAGAWLHDALTLALPDKVLCRPDCAGICPECGARLNDVDPAEHSHERPPDPRFAKLRELLDE